MMMEETEIWRAAGLLVDQKGRDAVRVANRRVRELERQGDVVGANTWREIADAVKQLNKAEALTHG